MLFQVSAQFRDSFCPNYPRAGIRIEIGAMAVKSNFEAAVCDFRQCICPIRMGVMQPNWHFWRAECVIPRGRPQKEYVLPSGPNAIPEQIGKQLGQPGSAGKDEHSGGEAITGAGIYRLQFAIS